MPDDPAAPPPGDPVQHGGEDCVYTVWKRCWNCGATWQGKSFVDRPDATEEKPAPGMCSACITREDDRLREQTGTVTEAGVPVVDLLALRAPRRVAEEGE